MILDLDFNFKSLEGNEIEGQSAAKLVATMLAGKPEGIDIAKAAVWCVEFYKESKIEIDKVDLENLEKFFKKQGEEKGGSITVLAWFQIQEAIDKAKQEAMDKAKVVA